MPDYVLGLDLGPNSIGWALLTADFQETSDRLTHEVTGFLPTERAGHPPLGVRVFEAGLDNFGTQKEKSLCQDRRTARSMRRNHQRRNARRQFVKRTLVRAGLLPADPAAFQELCELDPYELRARALDQPLQPFELGRALYHLAQRRGFKSNRKSGQAKEDRGILAEIGQLAGEIQDSGCRTLGEYLYRIGRDEAGTNQPLLRGRIRLRGRHTRRDMYLEEFEQILAAQRPHHPQALGDEVIEKLRWGIFFQHPFEVTDERRRRAPSRANLHRAPSIRPCPLEPDQRCCPRSDWHAQRFRLLKEVNNLKISEHFGPERPLDPDERQAVLEYLSTKDRCKFDDLRKVLAKLGRDPYARFNLERGGRKGLDGNVVDHRLAGLFKPKKKWALLDDGIKHRLREALIHEEDPDRLREDLLSAGADPEKVEKVLDWSPPDAYLGYSRKAIEKLIPHLEEGCKEYEAVQRAYPDRPESAAFDRLPSLAAKDLPPDLRNITNPVVRRALVELRKVVNAIVREHGRPRRIIVELARDMKEGPEGRARLSAKNRRNEQERRQAQEVVHELGGNPRSRNDVNRYLMWKEQGGICLYTGRPIPQHEIFHEGEWEVDHILPRWQSLDDSQANKVLVHRSANQEKGDRTPCQWLGKDSEAYRQLLQRAQEMVDQHGFHPGKLSRLRQEAVEAEGFAQRQLNDTRYITRAVVQYLNLLYPPELREGEKAVQSCRGSLTAELRRQWGLLDLLDPIEDLEGNRVLGPPGEDGQPRKSRADHRHHAIDAVVIAASSRAYLKRYQDYWKNQGSGASSPPPLPPPWPTIRKEVAEAARQIIVSHRPIRKIRGAFHEETFYGQAKDRKGPVPGQFVTRKPLSALTGRSLAGIRDPRIKEILEARLRDRGWDGKSNTLPKDWWQPEPTMPSGVPIRKVRVTSTMTNPLQLGHRFAVLGNNHHLELYRDPKNGGGLVGKVVSQLEAAARVRRLGQAVVQRDGGEGLEFAFSLCRKDTVLVCRPEIGDTVPCVVQVISQPTPKGLDLYLRDHRDSRPATEGNRSPFKRVTSFRTLTKLGVRKVQVDPLGRLSPSAD